MKTDERTDHRTPDSLLNLASDEQVATVSAAETAATVAHGEEYVDSELLTEGVQRSHRAVVSMDAGRARSAVHEQTWSKRVTPLETPSSTACA
jgi:hypothetical protein